MSNKLNTSPTPNLSENAPNVSPTQENRLNEAEERQEEISEIGKDTLRNLTRKIKNWHFDKQWLSALEKSFFQQLKDYLKLNPNTTHLAQTVFKDGTVKSKIIGCHQRLVDLINIKVEHILQGNIWTVSLGAVNSLIQDTEVRNLFNLLQKRRQKELDQNPKAQLPKFRLPLDTTSVKIKSLKHDGKRYRGKCIATIETVSLPFDDSIRAVMVSFGFEVSDSDFETAKKQLYQNLKAGVEKEPNLELKPQDIEKIDEKENIGNLANAFSPPPTQQNLPLFPTAPAMSPHEEPQPDQKEQECTKSSLDIVKENIKCLSLSEKEQLLAELQAEIRQTKQQIDNTIQCEQQELRDLTKEEKKQIREKYIDIEQRKNAALSKLDLTNLTVVAAREARKKVLEPFEKEENLLKEEVKAIFDRSYLSDAMVFFYPTPSNTSQYNYLKMEIHYLGVVEKFSLGSLVSNPRKTRAKKAMVH